MPRPPQPPIHLRSARMLDVVAGEIVEPGDLLIEGERIVAVAPTSVPSDAIMRLDLLPDTVEVDDSADEG